MSLLVDEADVAYTGRGVTITTLLDAITALTRDLKLEPAVR